MKKKLFAVLLLICLCLLPQMALADDTTTYPAFPGTGLDWSTNLPNAETTWQAGEGTVTYTPATATANAKVEFNNATINSNDPIIQITATNTNFAGLDIIIKGQNDLSTVSNTFPFTLSGDYNITITGDKDSVLNINTEGNAFVIYDDTTISGGTYNFTGLIIQGSLTIKNGAEVNLTSKYGQNAHIQGNLEIDNSTLNIIDTCTDNYVTIFYKTTLKNGANMSVQATSPVSTTHPINIDTTSQFTLENDTPMKLAYKIINNGTFYNNGVIDISDCDISNTTPTDFITAMKLSGCGTVSYNRDHYANNGTKMGLYKPQQDLASATGNIYEHYEGVYHFEWDNTNKILTLNNVYIDELILPTYDDVTIIIDGTAVINDIHYTETYGTSKWTIKGQNPGQTDKLYGAGIKDSSSYHSPAIDFDNGSLYIENLNAELYYLQQTGTPQPFHITDSNVTVYNGIMYYDPFQPENAEEYGLQVKNSQLTVKGGTYGTLFAGIITMDDNSVITLDGAYISNCGNLENGLDGLKPYLPGGYHIGHEQTGYNDDGTPQYAKAVTILVTSTGKPATHITLKKQSTGSGSGSRSYTIKATADKGGEISPAGSVRVSKGNDKTFTITANDGYTIADVLVDGESVGAVATYTFEDVRTTHTIAASFTATQTTPAGLNSRDHIAYVQGYADGTIQPNANITRAETAAMIYRLLTDERLAEIKTDTHTFSDIPAGAWYTTAVATMANGGYITGYADGTFHGNANITRAEFVTMLARFIDVADVDCDFTDITAAHWAYKYVATATANEWLTGYEDGTFRPDNNITRAEAIAIINRALARGVNADGLLSNIKSFPDNNIGDWFYYDVVEATNAHDYTGNRPNETWTKLN